jgi:hypothetical protein
VLRLEAGDEPAILLDYHDRGFQVSARRTLLVGTRLSLVLPNCLPVHAQVRWSLGGRAGCLFDNPVQEELVRVAIERATSDD